jgi:hypothetical protein
MCSKLSNTLYALLLSKFLLHLPFVQTSFADQTNNTNNKSYAAAYYLIPPFVPLLNRLLYEPLFFSEFCSQIPSKYLKCLKLSILSIFSYSNYFCNILTKYACKIKYTCYEHSPTCFGTDCIIFREYFIVCSKLPLKISFERSP